MATLSDPKSGAMGRAAKRLRQRQRTKLAKLARAEAMLREVTSTNFDDQAENWSAVETLRKSDKGANLLQDDGASEFSTSASSDFQSSLDEALPEISSLESHGEWQQMQRTTQMHAWRDACPGEEAPHSYHVGMGLSLGILRPVEDVSIPPDLDAGFTGIGMASDCDKIPHYQRHAPANLDFDNFDSTRNSSVCATSGDGETSECPTPREFWPATPEMSPRSPKHPWLFVPELRFS